ncbi:MAG: hypothetical protein ACYDCN_01435 [Bacteroidia bacterium]
MDFSAEDIVGVFQILNFTLYQKVKKDILASDSFYTEFTQKTINPLRIKIEVTINITQKLEPICVIKSQSLFTVKNKITGVSKAEKIFLIKEMMKQTIIKLQEELLKDSEIDFDLMVPPDDEILKSVGNKSTLN